MKESYLTPSRTVKELEKYIVAQDEAKRAVAIALRNRWRRQKLPVRMRDEVAPKNIIMIGPTGVGKTEIARRLANLAQAPFLKVEASKYTEVGYMGRDVESMVRDLTSTAVYTVKMEMLRDVQHKAEKMAETRLLDLLLPLPRVDSVATEEEATRRSRAEQARSRLLAQLRNRELENRVVEVQISERSTPMVEVFSTMGAEQMGMNLQEMLGEMMPRRQRTRRVPVREARRILAEEESQKLIDKDKMVEEALHRVENSGIIFIDEMDKLIGGGNDQVDVSRQGVQRDMLPIVEGTTVMTRHGTVQTDHILFIAAGAFHGASPSDLIPELQGRFPIRVELARLTEGDFLRILTEPRNALVRQYEALIKTEGLKLVFEPEALKEISHLAYLVNERTEDIGARRLHTVMEKLLEDVSFRAPQLRRKSFTVDAAYVRSQLGEIVEHEDLSRYIL